MSIVMERCLPLINKVGKVKFTLDSFEIKIEGLEPIQGSTNLQIVVDETAIYHRSYSLDLTVHMKVLNGKGCAVLQSVGSDEEYHVSFLDFVRMLN